MVQMLLRVGGHVPHHPLALQDSELLLIIVIVLIQMQVTKMAYHLDSVFNFNYDLPHYGAGL